MNNEHVYDDDTAYGEATSCARDGLDELDAASVVMIETGCTWACAVAVVREAYACEQQYCEGW